MLPPIPAAAAGSPGWIIYHVLSDAHSALLRTNCTSSPARTLARLVQAAQQHVNHTDMLVLLTDDENLRGKAHAAGIAAHRSNSLSPRSVYDHLVCRLTLIRHIIADTMPHAMETHQMAVSPSEMGFWDCRDATALYSQLLLREPARQVAVIGHVPAMSDSWSASLQNLVQLTTTEGRFFRGPL